MASTAPRLPGSVSGGGNLLCCFGLGIANFASGREQRPADLVGAIEREGLRVVAAFGATGNLVVAGRRRSATWVRSLLRAVSGRDWAIVSTAEVARALAALGPVRHRGPVRWTPGLAFRVSGEAEATAPVRDTIRARLEPLTPRIVAVRKRDILDGPRLDPHRRLGGWGAISRDVASQLGGTWTARSARTVAGLLRGVQGDP